jgi:hypothetical protein
LPRHAIADNPDQARNTAELKDGFGDKLVFFWGLTGFPGSVIRIRGIFMVQVDLKSELVSWSQTFSVGIRIIDDQHEAFILEVVKKAIATRKADGKLSITRADIPV